MPKHPSKKSTSQKSKPRHDSHKQKPYYPQYTSIYTVKEKPKVGVQDVSHNYKNLSTPEDNTVSTFFCNQEDKTIEVSLLDFRFVPNKIKVDVDTTVKWRVDKNETVHKSGLYGSETRSFVIVVEGPEHVESDLLSKGQTFTHKFEKTGSFSVRCANYPQIQGFIEVHDPKETNSHEEFLGSTIEPSPILRSCDEEEFNQKNIFEIKDPLCLLKDLENEEIKELILELSLKGVSDKANSNFQDDGNRAHEAMDQAIRYDFAKDQLLKTQDVNIFDELVSREFNGLKIKTLGSSPNRKNFNLCLNNRIEVEQEFQKEELNEIKSQHEDIQVNFENDLKIRPYPLEDYIWPSPLPTLVSRKNPKDEEQKFDQALNHSQECIEEENDQCEEVIPNADRFLAFLKDGVKDFRVITENKGPRRNSRQRRISIKKSDDEEKEKVELLKSFLSNRFMFAEELGS